MDHELSIPGPNGPTKLTVPPGSSVIFVGANGSGKTRLAVYIEDCLAENAHRISAHRALALNPEVQKIGEEKALNGLRTGHGGSVGFSTSTRTGKRWRGKAATTLLDDFDFLLQALFAEQANTALETHKRVRSNRDIIKEEINGTNFERLKEIWTSLLPHRTLTVSADNIIVSPPEPNEQYSASELSDGERSIFYLIGQTLTAKKDSLLIVDEPELHIHRSIIDKLWDKLQSARSDCGFLFITHDLEFAASRPAQKFVIREFTPKPEKWTIEAVPEDSGFSEEITTLILGSRKPVLFVEGDERSLDRSIYKNCYPEWTVIPRGSCRDVIHSVVAMRKNATLTRVICSGIVDRDDHQPEEILNLEKLGIRTLAVSEIENVILLPAVSRAILQHGNYSCDEIDDKLEKLKHEIFSTLDGRSSIESVVLRDCRRRIDRTLKKIDLKATDNLSELAESFKNQIGEIDINIIAKESKSRIEGKIDKKDLDGLLGVYDNKGLMNIAAKHLRGNKKGEFENWIVRTLRDENAPWLFNALREKLPEID